MDIRQFCDKMTEKYRERRLDTNLKRIRTLAGITQNELALQSGVPLRTIQQYEQKRKNINKAQAEYLISLSRALSCPPADLIEKV
jgi:transcriptional regulator with XRE-family HTH domain